MVVEAGAIDNPRLNTLRVEPRLQPVERLIKALGPDPDEPFCANAIWYGYGNPEISFRGFVKRYAGWQAEKPELRSEAAYRLTYRHLYDLLPDCHNCGYP